MYSNETADVQLNETDGMEAVVKAADQLAAYFQSITELLKVSAQEPSTNQSVTVGRNASRYILHLFVSTLKLCI